MKSSIHISELRALLHQSRVSGTPLSLRFWTRRGEIVEAPRAVPLSNGSPYDGWRNYRLLPSGEIRRIRDVCIFFANDLEVYL